MDPITWIADLRGPEFLVFYSVLSLVVVALCVAWSRRCDPVATMVAVPSHPEANGDPYELAWLRGGAAGMLTTALFALRQRNLLAVGDGVVARVPGAPAPANAVERLVFDATGDYQKPSEVLSNGRLKGALDRLAGAYRDKHLRAGFVTTDGERARAWAATLTGLAVVLGVGGFKLAVALSRGRTNVGFLIVIAVVVAVVLVVACRPRRLNARGRAYLKSLTESFKLWGANAAHSPAADTMLPLYVAMLGTGILAGTQYEAVNRAFNPPSSSSVSGCGSGSSCSSGGSSCGGGGCGGGCGGCGG